MNIRKATVGDAEAIIALHADTVKRINSWDYSVAEINAWLSKQRPDRVRSLISDGKVTVAVDEADRIIGFATRHAEEIHGMYVFADHLRQGIASALYTKVESDAQAEGHDRLIAESSLAAVQFYRSMGFVETERKQWPVSDSLSIEVIVMHKEIELPTSGCT
jgi:putative acetyltransferase